MCGIAGIVDPSLAAPAVRAALTRMTDALVHRGPDDAGLAAEDGIGIAMRRLSIIDLAGGHQPIGSEDGQIEVVCNGEIYNHLELRTGLERRGHRFRTRSDTEVIVHLYEELGIDCFAKLRGMFGIAIWDRRRQRIVLARDRLGKKPLFYAHHGPRLLLASEIKAILAADPSLAEEDPGGLVPYLRFGFVPEPRTMFVGIDKLPAAHSAVFEGGRLTIRPYWQLRFPEMPAAVDPREAAERLDVLLSEAVRIRLMSDVPLGVFLSGGLDSSAIVAYAHRAGLRPLKTFTIGLDRPEWDESPDAEVVARHFQTEHHVLHVSEADLTHNLPDTLLELVRHVDEPFADDSSLPTYVVAKLAREHVTTILSGDGGDELFAGYSTYQGIRFADYYRRVPQWLGRGVLPGVARRLARVLPERGRYAALRVARVLGDSTLPFEEAYYAKSSRCKGVSLDRLLSRDALGQIGRIVGPVFPDHVTSVMASGLPPLSKMSYVDLRFYLVEDMLVKVDRMSMAHSLEVRSPLLDHRVVEYVASLPPSLKLRGWTTKAVLRDAVRPHLPRRTMRKRKQGFGVPLRHWLRAGLCEMVSDYLEAEHGRLPAGVFNRAMVRKLIREHRQGTADHSAMIWSLVNYAAWRDLYLDGQPAGACPPAAAVVGKPCRNATTTPSC